MNTIKESKHKVLIIIIGVVLSLTLIIGVGYAFFLAGIGGFSNTDLDIVSEVSENATFTEGDPINLYAIYDNFNENTGSLSDETTSTAHLVASSETGSATLDYNVYLQIDSNTFEYSQNEDTPELMLTITNPSAKEITALKGFEYTTITDSYSGSKITGFDITNFNGIIPIYEDYNITTTSTSTGTTQDWKVKITFVNLPNDQTLNEGKTLDASLVLGQDKLVSTINYVYAENSLADQIIDNNEGFYKIINKATPNFNAVATTNEGMYMSFDNYGKSFYFRGAVDNNWVYWAGFYWRIIRINGDGSVRLIYSGTTEPNNTTKTVMAGAGTQIHSSTAFNTIYNNAKYVGYTYDAENINSTIKNVIDTWYNTNIIAAGKSNDVADTIYCNDKSVYSTTGSHIYYGAYGRLNTENKTPMLTCSRIIDSYTVDDIIHGNGVLTNPVTLTTVDEVAFAGGLFNTSNTKYYLYTGNAFWTISPYSYVSSSTTFFIQTSGQITATSNYFPYGVRPVLSLKNTTAFTGTGTWDDPYTIN